MNNTNREVKILPPFKRLCMTIGELPTSYVESMTYYESLLWFTKYLHDTVIPAINNNGEAVKELQEKYIELKNYVDTYFDNLDLQTEVNNKLDEMAEQGELQTLIALYLQMGSVLAYDTKSALKGAENIAEGSICKTIGENLYNDGKGNFYKIRLLEEGDVIDDDLLLELSNYPTLVAEKLPSYLEVVYDTVSDLVNDESLVSGKNVRTLGYYSINDGGGAYYKIREITGADTPNELSLITINENLVAELVLDSSMNVKQFGAKGNGTDNDTDSFNLALSSCNDIIINDETYLIDHIIINKSCKLSGTGCIKLNNETGLTLAHDNIIIDGLTFDGNNKTYTVIVNSNNTTVRNCKFVGEIGNYLRANNYSNVTFDNNLFDGTDVTGKLITPVVFIGTKYSKCTNSTFINVKGFNVQTLLNAENIIIENNTFRNRIIKINETARAGQTSFIIDTDGVHYARTGIKVNNNFNNNFTITETEDGYSVNFTEGLSNGDVLTFYGCDSLECLNINSNSYNIEILNNMIDGSGDSGIVICCDYHNGILNPSAATEEDYPSDVIVKNNYVKNCFYGGIVETRRVKNVLISGNTVESVALAINSQDNEYNSCIRVIGNSNIVDANIMKVNTNDIQRYGIVFRNTAQEEKDKIVISNNQYIGNFTSRKTSLSGATSSTIYGGVRDYEDPEILYGTCNLNDTWSGNPNNEIYFSYSKTGSGVTRDTTNGLIDTAPCIATIGGSYIEVYPCYPYFRNRILNIDFDCKAGDTAAKSYIRVYYKSNSSLPYQQLEYRPTDTNWHHKRLQIVLDGVYTMLVRIGADADATPSYFQNIKFSVQDYK